MRIRLITAVFVLAVAVSPEAQEPAFEVASVKSAPSPGRGWLTTVPGEVFFEGIPLRIIVPAAFDVPVPLMELRVVWSPAAQQLFFRPLFTIQAKGEPGQSQTAMLRTLLEDRFGMKWHRETRQVPIYALTVKTPGTLGPWLKPTPHNCRDYIAGGGRKGDADSPRDGEVEICWSGATPRERFGEQVNMSAGTMQDFIERVAIPRTAGDRPVIDETGLAGNYLWGIAVRPEPAAIFPALEDQLGLTLERRNGPWEVIVIDDIRMPTPN